MQNKPLITFALVAYNQEKFIQDALQGAFDQTYTPLEIILSDDCSSDRTFEIMTEMTASYTGPHKIVLNKNNSNVGIGAHINRVMALVKGELIVVAAGDDISLPERTEVTYQAWEASGRKATSIFSSHIIISKDGVSSNISGMREIPDGHALFSHLDGNILNYLSRKAPIVNGCTHAWSPHLFNFFGPIKSDLEDVVLSFRTLAIGKMLYINKPLVKWRRHGDNVSFMATQNEIISFEHRETRLRWVDEQYINAYDNMLLDIKTLSSEGRIDEIYLKRLNKKAYRFRYFYYLERQMMEDSIFQRFLTIATAIRRGQFRLALRFLPRALPNKVYRKLYMLRERWISR